jgi:prephenate dehydrogenase
MSDNSTSPARPPCGQVTIVGVGLLGGSLGLALHARGMAQRVVGVGRRVERLAQAKGLGAIDEATTDLAEGVADADLIVCGTPVQHIVEILPDVAKAARPGALVTDLGSTKGAIAAAARCFEGSDAAFVGSHPMAGSDRSGVEFAAADLYEGTTTFIAVELDTPKDRVAELSRLWRAVGSRVVLIHPERHDRLVAAISHLPHLLAVAAVRTVADVHEDENFLRWVIGNGFRDTTRVAQGSIEMWSDICATNPAAIAEALDAFAEKLAEIRAEVAGGNPRALAEILEQARRFRGQLNVEE